MQLHDLDSITIANQKRHATLNATLQHESLIGPQTLHELAVPNTTMSVREHLPHVQTTSKLKKVASCMVPSLGTQGLTCLVSVPPICTAWSQLPLTCCSQDSTLCIAVCLILI